MTEESTDALVKFGADNVLEFAGLVVGFGVVNRECVFEQALGQPVAAHDITRATTSVSRQSNFPILQLD